MFDDEDRMWEDEDYDALDAFYAAQDKLEAATLALYNQDEDEVPEGTTDLEQWEAELSLPDHYGNRAYTHWFVEVAL